LQLPLNTNVLRFNASNIDLPACFSEVSVPDRLVYLSVIHSPVQGAQRHHAIMDLSAAVSKIVDNWKSNTLKHVILVSMTLNVNDILLIMF